MLNPFYCPRCKTSSIVEYPDTIECPDCFLEFNKNFIGVIPDDEILAIAEMDAIIEESGELKDPKKAKKFFDSLMRDLNDDC